MHTFNCKFQLNLSWRDLVIELAATVIAFAIIALVALVFCWCFYIPFH